MKFNIEVDKSMVGHTLFAVGQHNAKPRGEENPIHVVEVVSVARTNCVIRFCATGREVKLTTGGSHPQNFNYDFFRSVDDYRAAQAIIPIVDAVRYPKVPLSPETILKVAELLGIDTSVEHLIKGKKDNA